MIKPSFHERLWDLQERKAGEARLKTHLERERIGAKLEMNSSFEKIGTRSLYAQFDDIVRNAFLRLNAKMPEIKKLSREFRPF